MNGRSALERPVDPPGTTSAEFLLRAKRGREVNEVSDLIPGMVIETMSARPHRDGMMKTNTVSKMIGDKP